MDKDNDLYSTIDYEFDGTIDDIPVIRDICKEFNLQVESYWIRPTDEDDIIFTDTEFIVARSKPVLPERYSRIFSVLIQDKEHNYNAQFADSLIEKCITNICVLEGCLEKEIEE